jgi:hypothetical protein
MRERRQQLQEARGLWPLHLGAVPPFESTPRAIIRCPKRELHEICGRGELGQPHVVEVTGRVLALGHTTRGSTHRPEAETFTGDTRSAEPDDVDTHRSSRGPVPSCRRVPQEPDEIGVRRRLSELAQLSGQLAAVIRRVVDDVPHQLSERVRIRMAVQRVI